MLFEILICVVLGHYVFLKFIYILSICIFCIYIDKGIKLLRSSTIGCEIQGVDMGIWVYADIILLSPSRTGLQKMVKICENFAKATKLKLSTNI